MDRWGMHRISYISIGNSNHQVRLGCANLWIDALCIIQDDRLDWARESVKMGSVYENAHLTIAATDGHNGSYRLLDNTYDIFIDDYVVKLRCSSDDADMGLMYLRPTKAPPKKNQACIDKSPLNQRAWVTQERILSRRILHYTRGMIYWECDANLQGLNGNFVPIWSEACIREQLLTVNMEGPITNESYCDEMNKVTWEGG